MVIATGTMCSKKRTFHSSSPYIICQPQDIIDLFPKTPDEIKKQADAVLVLAQKAVDDIIAVPDEQRTFDNTMRALDTLVAQSDFAIKGATFEIIEYTHPDLAMRDAAHEAIVRLQSWSVDALSNNKQLYNACKTYAQSSVDKEVLSDAEHYFITETLESFERAGLNLPDDELEVVKQLKKEIQLLALNFERAIAQDTSTVIVSKEDLAGLEDEFIATLKRTDNDKYVLGVDYPTYDAVMHRCDVEETRKQLSQAFSNRAYPANESTIQELIAKRDALAKKLGYASYNHLDIADQMAKTPERAESFLKDIIERSRAKEEQEFKALTAKLPTSVTLTAEGKVKPWDLAYLKAAYKKQYAIDENKIAEYFPMSKTIDGLLAIYKAFFSLDFHYESLPGLWHEDVMLVKVISQDTQRVIGYLLLDLYPRANKFSHACHAGIIPAFKCGDGTVRAPLSLVIANFTKPTETKPSLLTRHEVSTFFHEFGHALHAILGATTLASQAGTHVKCDFVELPSQMLEEWLLDKDILRSLSSHYITGQELSDETLDAILMLKNFDSGHFVQTQAFYSLLSLRFFDTGAQKDPHAILTQLFLQLRPYVEFDSTNHFYASFGHLSGYASKYYGYMWSKVFALDIFEKIKEEGLLNPVIGKRYVDCIIGQGGSADPDALLYNFLGRAPNNDAFLRSLGLSV